MPEKGAMDGAQDKRKFHDAIHCPAVRHCMKLLGQRLIARDFDRQVTELQIRIVVQNGYTSLGMPVSGAAG